MSKSKAILVATTQLLGGVKGKDDVVTPAALKAGEELTTEMRKALGLDNQGVAALVESGVLLEVQARVAEPGEASDDRALRAATERADKAEQDLAAANERITTLTGQLETASAAAAEATQAKTDLAAANERITALTTDLAEAKKPAKA